MHWHDFVVFGLILCASLLHTHGFPITFDTLTRQKRSPQDNRLLLQSSGALNLVGLNIPGVASQVRRRLHDLIDTVTNTQNVEVIVQVEPSSVNQYGQQYGYANQYQGGEQYQDFRPGNGPPPPPPSRPFRPHPRRPHGHHPRGPPHRHPPRGRPHGPPPPPYDVPSPPEQGIEEEEDTRPIFADYPNYPGKADSPTTGSINLDDQSKNIKDGNVAGYIEDNFPVILLNENEIR